MFGYKTIDDFVEVSAAKKRKLDSIQQEGEEAGASGAANQSGSASSSKCEATASTSANISSETEAMAANSATVIDEALYSRQIYVLGEDGMLQLAQSDILVSGLGGLGVEIAKNVVLGGVKSITLHDKANCTIRDLSSQFFLTEADIGKNRAELSLEKLAALNRYVTTSAYTGDLTEEILKYFRVVILCDASTAEQKRIAKFTHENGVALVIAETRGLFGKIFCDFGEHFTIHDTDGVQPVFPQVVSITKDSEGVVTCFDETKHGFEDGAYVTFSEVQGMTELNGCEPIKIKVLGPYTFSIGDTRTYSEYIGGGIVTQVKMSKTISFKPLEVADKEFECVMSDYGKLDHPETLHAAFKALDQFIEQEGRLPKPWNAEDAHKVLELTRAINPRIKESLVFIFAKTCAGKLSPIDAAIGGIVAQEAFKACTSKFTPISQFFYYDAIECINEEPSEEDAQPLGCRYDSQIAIFGKSFQDKLAKLRYLIVGAGGIGCELLKNFAMVGIGVKGGKIVITDMEIIKKSNLNRQFLFRPQDVQKSKTVTAAEAVKKINNEVNVIARQLPVGIETAETFSEEFFGQFDGVATGVDNLAARIYLDRQCVFNRIPLVDSGTLGTMGSTQVVVPFLSESYSSSQDPQERSFPMCLIRSFPYAIEHTLQWARDTFDNVFKRATQNASLYINDPTFVGKLFKLTDAHSLQILRSIRIALIDCKPKDFADCVKWARYHWQDLFSNKIKQLLHNFPPDRMTPIGQPFWLGPKRCPEPLIFDLENPLHLDYIYATANLRAKIYGIPQIRDRKAVAKIVAQIKVPKFTPGLGVRIEAAEGNINDASYKKRAAEMDEIETHRILTELQRVTPLNSNISSLEFEKDDDNNLHMDFIVAASNLRAANYKIPPADRMKSKLIAGEIIPAIATTTSVVSGFSTLEIIKLAHRGTSLEKYKNGFFNLALPLVTFSEPVMAEKNTYLRKEWTLWDRFEVTGEMTLRQFLDHFLKEHKLQITMLSTGVYLLYSYYISKAKYAARMPMTISAIVEKSSKKRIEPHERSLKLEMFAIDKKGKSVEVPYIRYILP